MEFSSPFRGFYLSTEKCVYDLPSQIKFSSPFRGFYLSTLASANERDVIYVLVPFSGFLSFYLQALIDHHSNESSRPLFGVSIFLRHIQLRSQGANTSSRPLFGVSIFLQRNAYYRFLNAAVLVPFSGFLSFYPSLYIPCYFCIYNLFCGLKIKYLENHIAIFTKYLLKPHNYLIG